MEKRNIVKEWQNISPKRQERNIVKEWQNVSPKRQERKHTRYITKVNAILSVLMRTNQALSSTQVRTESP